MSEVFEKKKITPFPKKNKTLYEEGKSNKKPWNPYQDVSEESGRQILVHFLPE